MSFEDEPEWMKKARTVPLHSTPESRKEHTRLQYGQSRGNAKPARDSDSTGAR